ncbi:MAG: carbamoyltransferase HypF [Alphaproteobacteria bacterium]|nr:carbamoyltransferase HypF [Alphaproteobacteria bacterium]
MAEGATELMREGRAIRVRGLVQGVGFRPTVWRLARDLGLDGEVWNDAGGVMVAAWGDGAALDDFLARLVSESPVLARIDGVEWHPLACRQANKGFSIAPSRAGTVHTGVAPDAATCPACLAEVLDAGDRRHGFPFTNCTHCGPRLSIVRAVPYDRANTSMAAFALCPDCRAEYEDPADRRFHAQPTACPACGPRAWLERFGDAGGAGLPEGDAVAVAAAALRGGAIVAVKGLGGFHLACDARNEQAVARLRGRKRRQAKPFALMARDLEVVRRYATVDDREAAQLRSPAAPIVILDARCDAPVAPSVAPGQSTLGFMLPYTPLHHLLLHEIDGPVVMTSGNFSEEPQCTGNGEARDRLGGIADYGLFHDREIVNRLDDSVVRVMAGAARPLRRARGLAPAPVMLPAGFERAGPLTALGGELKSTFCLAADGRAILSQHLGDLGDAATFEDFQRAFDLFAGLFDHVPETLVVDMHPGYLSARLGRAWAEERGLRLEAVQHHHAHIAACLAENGVPLDAPPLLGIALDGLGFGADGTLWGGEFLRTTYAGFERLGAFPAVPMPGGIQAIRQPWRSAWAHLDAALGWERCAGRYGARGIVRHLCGRPLDTLRAMQRKGLNTPYSSSCGRLFDAVAATVGICRAEMAYEGQAAIELEALAAGAEPAAVRPYPIGLRADEAPLRFDLAPLWAAILDDLEADVPVAVVAARFHAGLVSAIVEMADRLFERCGDGLDRTVALSGGVFQNRLLFEGLERALEARGFAVLSHRQVPANDGGLSLGQAAVAAARILQGREAGREGASSCV